MPKRGVVYDRCLGSRLPRHVYALIGIKSVLRSDLVKKNHNPVWPVRDARYLEYAKIHECFLVTSDRGLLKRAMKQKVSVIYIHPEIPFWGRVMRILREMEHPFYDFMLKNHVDLRNAWRDTPSWKYPKTVNSVARNRNGINDLTYKFM